MKLCDFHTTLGRVISNEEMYLERKVLKAQVSVLVEEADGREVIHEWGYTAKLMED